MLLSMIYQHIAADIRAGRIDKRKKRIEMTKEEKNEREVYVELILNNSLSKLDVQAYKCHTCHVPLTVIRDNPCHFSLERLDNAISHFGADDGNLKNIVFVARGLNTALGMSKLKMLRMFLRSPGATMVSRKTQFQRKRSMG